MPENPIIFTVGPLTGVYPLASKTVAMFKSPHTGNLGESHAGGRSAIAIRMAGYGAIVIQGRSEMPIYLVIDEDGVAFRDASALWGTRSAILSGSVLRRREVGSGLRTIMRIGRAGEKHGQLRVCRSPRPIATSDGSGWAPSSAASSSRPSSSAGGAT